MIKKLIKNMSKKIFNFGFLFLIVFSFGNFYANPVFAESANITQINFTSSPQTVNVNANSAVLTTQTQNSENQEEQVSETGTTLNYASTSATGQFSNANATSCADSFSDSGASFTLIMRKGSANKNFCYRDSTPGTYTLTVSVEGKSWTLATQEIVITGEETTPDPGPAPEPEPKPESAPTVTFIIRNGNSVLYNGSVPLPAAGAIPVNDANNVAHSVNGQSVLAILKSIDEASEGFSISDLQYYESFSSFYIKCILPNNEPEACDNWQYAVGSLTPSSSIDSTVLSGGETVGIYFGNSHQLVLSADSIMVNQSLSATAQKYDYENNVWNPLTGVSVGVTLPNPSESWNPTIVSTHPVDASGVANITIANANTYTLGIAEDFYFPSYAVTVSIVQSGSGSGNEEETSLTKNFNSQSALAYLKSVQATDGSFGGSDLYTDWAEIALGAGGITDSSRDKILTYFNAHNVLSSLLTDNERHAMTLLSLGQNPYSFGSVNYINAITSSFDGTQFGNANLINDDIFALIPLKNSGYDESDEMITKDIKFIISRQKSDGSWEESVDITAAAIQALESFESVFDVSNALIKATNYLTGKQNNDGGFGDSASSVYSTSWAMQAMGALGESWTKDGHTTSSYLGGQQAEDGAALPSSETLSNRIWATSYAIAGNSLKPWSEIMESFPKPAIQNNSNNSSGTSTPTNNMSTVSKTPTNSPQTNSEIKTIPAPVAVNTPVIAPVINKKTTTTPETQKSITVPENLPADAEEIIPGALAATAANALSAEETPKNTIPIALGVGTGTVLLYVAFKFFVK